MRQRASQTAPSRRYQWRDAHRWYLRRLRFVTGVLSEYAEAARASYEQMIRDFPPYPPHLIPEPRVQFIRDGSVWDGNPPIVRDPKG